MAQVALWGISYVNNGVGDGKIAANGPLNANVFANGSLIACSPEQIVPHFNRHRGNWNLTTFSATVFVCGFPVVRAGDSVACGHVIDPVSCSPNVFAG